MRLHLPKGLLAALLAACFALPSEAATTVTVGDYNGTFDSVTQGNAIPSDETTAIWVTTDRMYVGTGDGANLASEVALLNQAGVIILGNGTCSTSESTESITAKQLFLQAWKATKQEDITSNLIVGANSGDRNAAIRFGADGSYNIKVSGDITVGDDAKFIAGVSTGTYVLITGNIQGANKTLTLSNMNSDGAYKLTGDAGKTINLGGLIVSADSTTSHTSVAVDYDSATVGNLIVDPNASLANAGSLTITGSYVGSTITNTGTLTLADGALVEVGRLTNAITETATTDAEGTAISGRVTVNGDFTLASGGTVNTAGNVGFTYNGFSYSGALDTGNLAGTISGGYYRVVDGDEVTYSTASADTSITHIEVIGTLTGLKDASITTSIPITGNGSVAVDGVLETHVADLDQFTGTISLTGTSTDNLAAIKFGNSNAHLTQVSKIQLKEFGYISGWGTNNNFSYVLEFDGGFLLANEGSWTGEKRLLSDSSIQVHKSATISGAFTALEGTELTIQKSTFGGDASQNPTLTFSGTVGKLDGATLKIEDGVTVAVTGRDGGNAQIAGDIVVKGGGTLKLTSADTLGYNGDGGDYTDSITLEGSTITVGGVSTKKVATLNLTATQTLTTDLILKGNTSIIGSAMNSFDGSITATGTNNVISNELKIRKNLTITVGNSADPTGSLEIAGKLGVFENFYGVLTKDGGGTLIVSGTGHDYTRAVTVNDGTLELRSAFNPVKIDLRGTDTTSGSLVIAAGGTGTVNLGSGDGDGLWMDADSTVSIRKAESETTRGGKLIFGTSTSGATISATDADADADASISSSTTGQYTFSSADFTLSNAEFLFNSTGQWGASLGNSLTNVSVINESSDLLLTVTHEGNTLRGVEATGGNIKFAANAEVTGSIKIADGKSVVVNSGAALTHDGFTYDGSTIKTANAADALSLFNNAVITGGTLTQKENADVGYKEIGATLTNVKLVNTGDHVTWLTAQSDTLSGMEIAGTLRVGQDDRTFNDVTQKLEGTFKKANVTVSGAATVTALKVDTESTLELAGQNTNSSITTLTGSGTLKTTAGKTTVSSASGFSGKLEATGGKLEATTTGSQSIAALTANGGNIDVFGVTSLTVKDMVIGDNSTVGVYSGAAASSTKGGLNISGSADAKASLTIGSGATLNTNLSLWNAKLTFQDGALAMGSSLTLIPDGSNELYINIGTMKAGESLTLFTGVNQFQASADAATIDEASKVFGNLTAGDFKLTYSGADNGGIVALVAQRDVPEPTTATLSLLALMGLAARRRRRKA